MVKQTSTLQPLAISQVLDLYLQVFGELYILKAEQLTRRLYKPGMITTVQTRLKRLVDAGYLHSFMLPTIKSKSPNMYALSAKGAGYLQEQHDIEAASVYKPVELKELSHPYLWHLLELNDLLIAVQTLGRAYPEYSVESMRHDLAMKKSPMRFSDGTGKNKKGETVTKNVEVWADGFVDIRKKRAGKKAVQWCFWLELDRGTEQTEDRFKEKIRRIYKVISKGVMQEYFEIKELTNVVFATTAGERRVEQMRRWAMNVLAELHAAPDMRDLFLFGVYEPGMNHEQVFFTERWLSPLKEAKPVALLEE